MPQITRFSTNFVENVSKIAVFVPKFDKNWALSLVPNQYNFSDSTIPLSSKFVLSGNSQHQGHSHTFESGGAQAPEIILGPFCFKKWRGPTLLLPQSQPKTGGARALPAHSKTTPQLLTQSFYDFNGHCFLIQQITVKV